MITFLETQSFWAQQNDVLLETGMLGSIGSKLELCYSQWVLVGAMDASNQTLV